MTTRRELANCIRALSMDAVQRANSGHPGMPMGMADIAEVLWGDFLKHNPGNPHWADRDRFVLSNGHASMLLYSLLHLTGYPLALEEIKNFRQLGSRTRGPPGARAGARHRDHHRPARPGPRQRGRHGARREDAGARSSTARASTIVDHHTYVFCGDGCLMEGISHEACSLAGTLGLGKLIVFYDDNGISIDGKVRGLVHRRHAEALRGLRLARHRRTSTAMTPRRSRPRSARRRRRPSRPSLICCKTIIGWGAPQQAGHRGGARRGARRRRSRGRAQGARLALRAVRDSRRAARRMGSPHAAAPPPKRTGSELFARYRDGAPGARARVRAAHARRAAAELDATPSRRRSPTTAQADGAAGHAPVLAGRART